MDVHHLARKETAATNSEQFAALFNNTTIGIVITNHQGAIINFNEHAAQLFGYTKEELMGEPVEILLPGPIKLKHTAYRNSFYRHPQTRMMDTGRDLYARRKDQSEFPVEISLSPYWVNNEVYVITFVVDISVRKNAETTLKSQKQELEEKTRQIEKMNLELEKLVENRTKMLKEALGELERSKEELKIALEKEKDLSEQKSRFVSMASHEFRTPLSTILSSVSLAQKYNTPADEQKRNKHLQRIQDSVHNLTFILEDFLSLGRLEEGQVVAQPEVLSRAQFLKELDDTIQQMVQVTKKEQQLELFHDVPGEIIIDKKLLHNILVNLISNAIKYSPENSRINIGCNKEADQLKISISDHGIGIPEEDQKRLFERFFRARNAASIQGTGLGLHIVGRYLQLMNGSIKMSSKENAGTTFTIYVPQV